jgi:hypothetical protein
MEKTEVAAFVCSHIFDGTHPVLLVSTEDGDWQCLCGGLHDETEVPRVIGLNHLLDRDPTLREVLDLPAGCIAERPALGAPWSREGPET